MKRRNSKAKVLALAAMCAIFSGGYSGLNPAYANNSWSIDVGASNLVDSKNGKVTGTINIDTNVLAFTLNNKLSGLSISQGGITLGTLANNVQAITYTASTSGASAKTTIDSDTIINGELTAKNKLTLTNGNTSAYLDVDQVGKLSQLLHSTIAGQKTVIDAGDGSKVGGVEFNAGAVTGVKSINADDNYAKFRVGEVDDQYIFRAGNLKITTDKTEYGEYGSKITFTNTNDSSSVTLEEMMHAADATKKISSGKITDYQGTERRVTYIEGIGGFEFRDDGRLTIGTSNTHSAMIDGGYGILVGHQGQVLKLLEHDSSVTAEQKEAYLTKIAGMSNAGVFAGGIEFKDAKAGMSNADGSLKAASGKFTVDKDGALTAGKLTLSEGNTSAYLDVDQVGRLSQLLNSTIAGQKTVIDAGDGSKVGGVEFNAGAVTGVKSINANDNSAKFKVTEDGSNYTFRAGNFQVTTGKENGVLNGEITFADTNRPNKNDEITLSEIISTRDKTKVITNSKTVGSENYESTKIRDVLEVRDDGKVTIAGKLTAGSDSKIGNITISDGQLSTSYSGAEGGIARVNVTDLYDDHKIITEDTTNTYSSKNVKLKIDSLEQSRTNLGAKIEKIERFTNNDNNKQGTSIAGNFDVYDDGTVIINNGQTQQVTIDSNGIKVGTGSAYINNDGFKAGADDKNSLTTTGLKAEEIRAGNNNTEFFVDGSGNVVAAGSLNAAGGKFDVSSSGDITARGFLSVAGDKFRVNADGSMNANNKFIVGADGALRASDDKFTADKDGNVRAIGSLSAANDKFQVGTDGSINVNNRKFIVDADGTISSEGTLSVAGGNFSVDAEGALKAANNNFSVDAEGKLISASGSKIGDVTIDGESLSNGTKSITVSDLAADHTLVTDATRGNESLYNQIVDVQNFANGLDDRTGGIRRVSDPNDSTKHSTLIEGVFLVDNNGTATITEGFKAGTDGKNSLTTTGLKAKEIRAGENNKEFIVDGSGNVVAFGTLHVAGGEFYVGTDGDITTSSTLSVAGNKFKVDTDGSINVNQKFIVDADGTISSEGTLSVAGGKFFVNADGVVTAGSVKMDTIDAASGAGVTVGGVVLKDKTITAADGKFEIDADGALKAANNNFSVDKDGKLMSASGSQIGSVTIAGESLSNGTKSIKVSELADDHDLVNNETKGNVSLYNGLSSVQTLANSLNTRTAGITRDTTGTAITTIEGKLQVSSNGTVKINEGEDQQVIIDSNGIKVGTGSAYINNDGFKAGADGKNSLTTSGLTAKTIKAGTNNDAFTVDENGNVVANGSLSTASGKFSIDADGALKAANNSFSVDKDGNIAANGTLSVANGKFQIDASGVVTAGSVKMDTIDAADTSKGITVGGVNLNDKTITAADGNFKVDKDGKITGASGSVIGDVTIEKDKLSTSTASVTVTDLAKDHDLVNDSDKGNENLYKQLGKVQTLSQSVDARTAGISRDTTSTATTTIEGKLKVARDGTVKINEGDAQQVIIDSNGIKVGKNSSRMNDSYGFVTTRDLYIGADSADAPTADGSKFYVKGEDGSIKAANGNFTVDKDGNTVVKGSLSVADGKFTVAEDGSTQIAGTLTTGKLVTDELVITGTGAAGGFPGGSISFGGNGTIKNNMKDGTKETTFETKVDGVSTEVKNGANQTNSEVNASGTTTTVTDGASTSGRNQTATTITDSVGANASSTMTADSITDKVGDNSVTTNANGTTFKNEISSTDSTTTNIKGSTITSTNGTGVGTLDGSQMTLTDGADKTELTAGGATFTKDGTTTTIAGDHISVKDAAGNTKDFNLSDITNKADQADLDALSKEVKTNTTAIAANAEAIQTNKNDIAHLKTSKADVDGSNIEVDAWNEKLGTGVIEKDNKGLVNGGVVFDALEKKADTDYVDNMASGLNNRMEAMSYSLTRDMNRVGAGAAALAGLHPQSYDPDCKLDFAAGYGHYRNANAMAIGMYYRPNAGTMFSLAGTIGNGDPMVSAGVSFKIGYNSKVEKVIVKKEDYDALQEQVNQLTQLVQQLIADKEATASK